MTDPLKIHLDAQLHPACFTAFDILYDKDHPVTDLPLIERKKLLQSSVQWESAYFAISRTVENHGVALHQLAEYQNLEGIVAKCKDSKYYFDKLTRDWIKCKNLIDDDYLVCGYIPKADGMTSLVLGQYRGLELIYKGHVTLGVSDGAYRKIQTTARIPNPNMAVPEENAHTVWIEPKQVCTVKYLSKNASGSLRQPVFKDLREDKRPEECFELPNGKDWK